MKNVRRKTGHKTPRKSAVVKTTEVGQAVIASLREVRAWQRGELALNVTEMPDPMSAMRLKATGRKGAR